MSVKYVGKVDKGGSQLTGIIFGYQGLFSAAKDDSRFLKSFLVVINLGIAIINFCRISGVSELRVCRVNVVWLLLFRRF